MGASRERIRTGGKFVTGKAYGQRLNIVLHS